MKLIFLLFVMSTQIFVNETTHSTMTPISSSIHLILIIDPHTNNLNLYLTTYYLRKFIKQIHSDQPRVSIITNEIVNKFHRISEKKLLIDSIKSINNCDYRMNFSNVLNLAQSLITNNKNIIFIFSDYFDVNNQIFKVLKRISRVFKFEHGIKNLNEIIMIKLECNIITEYKELVVYLDQDDSKCFIFENEKNVRSFSIKFDMIGTFQIDYVYLSKNNTFNKYKSLIQNNDDSYSKAFNFSQVLNNQVVFKIKGYALFNEVRVFIRLNFL
ncbi:unnamed protein product [Brachionus calyciflorus]|uniref:VWFA domain-containing protein n=1 Tax=Brachionus calyciflorus TaxID=104777 RepID=A0A814CM34_9BILA|nr:unnamed protein product [Brachionus calyciflorus]